MKFKLKIYVNGTYRWYWNDLSHRKDGPAIIYNTGSKSWRLNNNCKSKSININFII
jgi:hypothetical protein